MNQSSRTREKRRRRGEGERGGVHSSRGGVMGMRNERKREDTPHSTSTGCAVLLVVVE